LNNNLIVNTQISPQPITYLSNLSSLTFQSNSLSGMIFNNWTSFNSNQITLLYNDSALLALPYLINSLTNFYSRLNQIPLVNATLSPWPRTASNQIQNLDYSSFTALIILGTGLIIPLASFATEIVHDREV
jgi:hypothetical protein